MRKATVYYGLSTRLRTAPTRSRVHTTLAYIGGMPKVMNTEKSERSFFLSAAITTNAALFTRWRTSSVRRRRQVVGIAAAAACHFVPPSPAAADG